MVYERRGSGRPVVLLHGWCLNRRLWMYLEENLIGRCDVISPDLAGFGCSDALAGPYSLDRYAKDVGALLDELDIVGAVLIGFAFGAMVGLEAAAKDDSRIDSVISVGVPSAACSPYDKMGKSIRRDWPEFARRSAKALFHAPQSDATLGWLEAMFAATPLHVALAALGILAEYEPAAIMPKIRVPLLLLHGDKDLVAPVNVGESCAELAQDARLHVVEECGHLLVLDQKAKFSEIVNAYLDERSAAAPKRKRQGTPS